MQFYEKIWFKQGKKVLNMTKNGDILSQINGTMWINHLSFEAPEKDKKVWVSQSNANVGKRFWTLNICFRSEEGQPEISFIMCGQVIRLPQTEKEAWDEEIGV